MREAERLYFAALIYGEHLQSMDSLKIIGLRGYGQKDPLIEYKNEGYVFRNDELFIQCLCFNLNQNN